MESELVKLLKGMLCHVNLIPINKIENGKYTKSTNDNIIKFRDYLNDNGIVATIRRELGSDIDAACGQLRRSYQKNNKIFHTTLFFKVRYLKFKEGIRFGYLLNKY